MAILPSVDTMTRPVPSAGGGIVTYRPPQYSTAGAQALDLAASKLSGFSSDMEALIARQQQSIDETMADDAMNKLNAAKLDLTIGENGLLSKKGGDVLSHEYRKDFDQRFKGAVMDIDKTLANDNQRQLFRKRATVAYLQYQEDLMKHILSESESHARNVYDSVVDVEASNAEIKWNDPASINLSIARIENATSREAERLGWSADEEKAARIKAVSKVHEGVIAMALANENVLYADVYLEAHKGDIDAPTIARIQAAKEEQTRIKLANEERAYRWQERAEKEMHEKAALEGDELWRKGELSPEWIEANKERLSKEDARFYQRTLTTDVTTNPNIYSELRLRAGQGEDVRFEARRHLQEGDLKIGDFDKIVNTVEKNISNPWYKRGEEYIARFLKPSEINYNIDQAQAYANAADDWQKWADDHPKATEKEAEEIYRRIAQNYMTTEASNTLLTQPAPYYLVGSRLQPDIEATEDATYKAFLSGELNQEEFLRESQRIKNIRAILEKQEQMK